MSIGGSSLLSVLNGKESPVSVSVRNNSLRTWPWVLLTFGYAKDRKLVRFVHSIPLYKNISLLIHMCANNCLS
jgi:hypothetical protein